MLLEITAIGFSPDGSQMAARYDSDLAIACDYKGPIQLWDGNLSAAISPQELVT